MSFSVVLYTFVDYKPFTLVVLWLIDTTYFNSTYYCTVIERAERSDLQVNVSSLKCWVSTSGS